MDTRFARKVQEKTDAEDNYHDLSSEEVGKMKRNIANILQAGETVSFDWSELTILFAAVAQSAETYLLLRYLIGFTALR